MSTTVSIHQASGVVQLKLPPEMMERFKKLTPQQQQKFIKLQQEKLLQKKQQQQQQQQQQMQHQPPQQQPQAASGSTPRRTVSPGVSTAGGQSVPKSPPAGGGGASAAPTASSSREDMARRLQRLGFLRQQQQQLGDAQQSTPAVVSGNIQKANLLLGRGTRRAPSSAGGGDAAGGAGRRDSSPFNEADLDEERLFVLSTKHCGAQVITRYNLILHYFIAGVDVTAPPPPQPPPVPTTPTAPEASTEAELPVSEKTDGVPQEAFVLQTGIDAKPLEEGGVVANVGASILGTIGPSPPSAGGSQTAASPAPLDQPPVVPSLPAAAALAEAPAAPLGEGTSAQPPASSVPAHASITTAAPSGRSKGSSADSGTKKLRLVFCVAENPNAASRPAEERQAAWAALTSLSKLHMVCSLRTFKAMFACFFVDADDGGEEKVTPQQQRAKAAVRELTRSNAVPILNALFPIFDQSTAVPFTTSPLPPGHVISNPSGAYAGSRCWDRDGCVWCPVARLGRLVIEGGPATGEVQEGGGSSSVNRKTVYSLNPLTVALREDVGYVTKLPMMNELQDKFLNKRQSHLDEHQNNVANFHKEIAMLEIELEWAQEQVHTNRVKHDATMKRLQAELEALHMSLQESTGRRFYVPLKEKRMTLETCVPSGAIERSPIRQKFAWTSPYQRRADSPPSSKILSSPTGGHVPDGLAGTSVGRVLGRWSQANSYQAALPMQRPLKDEALNALGSPRGTKLHKEAANERATTSTVNSAVVGVRPLRPAGGVREDRESGDAFLSTQTSRALKF